MVPSVILSRVNAVRGIIFNPFSFIVVFVILGEWFETGAVNAVVEIIEAFIDDPKMCEVGCNVLEKVLFSASGKQ